MPRFTVRVELHNAKAEDYEQLHAAMKGQGFGRTITSSDGITYQLPTAEYNMERELDRGAVLERAKIAAAKTGKGFSVLVTEGARKWVGLDPVKSRTR